MKPSKRWLSCCVAGLALAFTAALETDSSAGEPLSADQILLRSRERRDGDDIYSDVKLSITDQKGSTRTRQLIYLQKDRGKDERLTLYFTGPGDVKGVGFQSVSYDEAAGRDDDQWIYMPAFRQVRRIASSDKRGSFMGSEFAYIDLDKLRVTDYQQRLIGEEQVLGRSCYVIERTPRSSAVVDKTGYSRTSVWVDKETFLVLKQTYHDAKGVLFKAMEVKALEEIQGIWTVMQSDMQDFVSKKSSSLTFSNVRYDVGLSEQLFQRDVLKTGVNDGNLPALR